MRPFLLLLALVLGGCLDSGESHRADASRETSITGSESGPGDGTFQGLDGPRITLFSSRGGVWRTGDEEEERTLFSEGKMDFRWSAVPGPSGAAVAGYSYKIDDADWTPYSLDVTEWQGMSPDVAPGVWTWFSLRAIDEEGFVSELTPRLLALLGPRKNVEHDRYVLVVLDTDPSAIQNAGVWPQDYRDIERSLILYFFADVDLQIYETLGLHAPPANVLSLATSVFWFHSADANNFDDSVLHSWHELGEGWNLLSSYVKSGGNLFLCGIQPVNPLRWFDGFALDEPQLVLQFPIQFEDTLNDAELIPHWVGADLRVGSVEATVPNLETSPVVALADSRISGANPYPDLEFDPLSIPDGFERGGFPYYDSGIAPRAGAVIAYEDSKTGESLGIRRLSAGGSNGSVVYLGFHPWFLKKSQFRSLIQAVLADFETAGLPSGEEPAPDLPGMADVP